MSIFSFQVAASLGPGQIADLRLAAAKMTGATRRAFEAEMALKYCQGNPLQAENVFGWSRQTVALGLAEKRSGIICLGAQLGVARLCTVWTSRSGWDSMALREFAGTAASRRPVSGKLGGSADLRRSASSV